MAYLIPKDPPKCFPRIAIRGTNFQIGRLPENDLCLPDSSVSRKHCEIQRKNADFILVDLGSLNGTRINGIPASTVILKDGDEIQIGNVSIIFELSEISSAAEPPEAGAEPPSTDSIFQKAEPAPSEAELDWADIARRVDELEPDDSKLVKPGSRNFYLFREFSRSIIQAQSEEELLEVAMDGIAWALSFDVAGIFLRDPENPQRIVPRIIRGTDPEDPLISTTILDYAARKNLAFLSSDTQTDPRLIQSESIFEIGIHSALASPLWDGQENIGVIYLANRLDEPSYQEGDLELLIFLANLLALGIRQVSLRDRVEKEHLLRSHLERYHSPETVDHIFNQAMNTGGRISASVQEITILFADIQNFTSISERLPPEEIADFLNGFFAYSTEIIFRYQGSLNKFLGDGLIAIFGAPVAIKNHAESAVLAAQGLFQETERYCQELPHSKRFQIKIGINTGEAVVGSFGTSKRMEYTALGDAVNIAARLEEIADGGQLLISGTTQEMVEGLFPTREMGFITPRGRAQRIKLYEVPEVC